MSEQDTLFSSTAMNWQMAQPPTPSPRKSPTTTTTDPEGPTCPTCRVNPAVWQVRNHKWGKYCGVSGCDSNTALCMNAKCGKRYDRTDPTTRLKYCSLKCMNIGNRYIASGNQPVQECIGCGEMTYSTAAPLCQRCQSGRTWVQSFKNHHAPQWVWQHMETDGTCMNTGCGKNITGATKTSHGHMRTLAAIDHDHACCHLAKHSCGKCVRAVLCNQCNQAIGLLYDEPARILGLYELVNGYHGNA